jgi:hypothetical protein
MYKPHLDRKFLHKQLVWQLLLFTAVFFVVTGIVSYDVIEGRIGILLALLGILVGSAVGYFFANKMFLISWHEDSQKVIIGRDKSTIIFIVIYIAFRLASRSVIGDFVASSVIAYFTLSTVGGLMLGRLLGMTRAIEKILAIQARTSA